MKIFNLDPKERNELEESLGSGICPELPHDVWEGRVRKCKELMEKRGLDALLVYAGGQVLTGREWARYFANYKEPLWNSETFIFIPLEGELTLILNFAHMVGPAKKMSPIKDIRAYEYFGAPLRYANFSKILKNILEEKGLERGKIGLGRHGMQGDFMPALLDQTVGETCANARLEDASDLLWELVQVKTDYDIKMLRKANKVLDEGTRAALEAMGEGVKEYELYSAFLEAICDRGAEVDEASSYHANIQSASGAEIPNKSFTATLRKTKKGDMIMFDGGATYRGYVTDNCRAAVIGQPSAEQRRMYEAVMSGLKAMADALRPGVTCAEICRIYFEEIEKLGYKRTQSHLLLGHGIGFMKNEPPIVLPWNTYALKENMVINLEAALMEINVARPRVEDSYLVTNKGGERLSELSQDLWVA